MKKQLHGHRCFLYLISEGERFCKVGIAKNPKARLAMLQGGNARRLVIVRVWEFKTFDMAYMVEQLVLHGSTNSAAVGEWIDKESQVVERLIDTIVRRVMQRKKIHTPRYFLAWNQLNTYNAGASL